LHTSLTGNAPPPVVIACRDSILRGTAESALVETFGAYSVEEARRRDRLQWYGENLTYDRLRSFWKVNVEGETASSLSFAGWQQYWTSDERNAQQSTIAWKQAPKSWPNLPTARTPAHYQPVSSSDLSAGAPLQELPRSGDAS